MRILAIESSCDETSAAVLERKDETISVKSHVTATSLAMHAKTGGIIPENAAREQVKFILPVITETLCEYSKNKKQKTIISNWEGARKILENEIDAIAVTSGPGLIGSLLVGVETAKVLSYIYGKPLVPVNHLLAHLYANFIKKNQESKNNNQNNLQPTTRRTEPLGGAYDLQHETQNPKPISLPFIGLIVSGGHTDLLMFQSHNTYTWLGGTRDDAAGEAFDKVGRLLNLAYPAGNEIERRAGLIKNTEIIFQSPMIYSKDFDFSFSGLKTEAMRFVTKQERLDEATINQICYATQKAIIDVLIRKTLKAVEKYYCKTVLVGGGVSANQTLKRAFDSIINNQESKINIKFPEKEYSTDNAAMVGAYALMNYKPVEWEKVNANPELYFS